ncbi:MAG: hypothetical protein QXR53_00190 [Candidatus Norongarragalinales archaeon]
MRRGQLFSVDFLLAVAVLTMALGIWLNSHSQIERNAGGSIANSSAFALAESYYSRLSAGESALQMGCLENAGVVVCDSCPSGGEKFFVQRIYSRAGSPKLLRVGSCS